MAFVAFFLTAACVFQEEKAPAGNETTAVSVNAVFEQPQSDTRTALNDENKVIWSAGDAFSLLTSKTNDRFEIVSGAGTASASFSGSLTGTAPYYAVYPYSENCRIEEGVLKFKLSQEQKYVNGTFASGASPAVATLASVNDAAQFKNLCGVLQINLCGSGKIKGVEVLNLDGKPLWGDCAVALDGKQGTNEQTMTVSGGSNAIKIVFDNEVTIMASTPRVVDVVVPAGSFAKGFSVKVFDASGAVVSFLTAQNEKVKIERSFITAMDKVKIPSNGEYLEVSRRGYYKDVFMDGGVGLTSRTELPACPYIGFTYDYMATSDSVFQRKLMVKSDVDANGAILYPDGEPRYRVIYVNGGNAMTHSKSLTQAGRNTIINYVHKGGSYIGTCAGAFMACRYKYVNGKVTDYSPEYIGIWPGVVQNTKLNDSYTGVTIDSGSPLLKYYDFGGDHHIDSLRHNGGCFCYVKAEFPPNGEVLAKYDLTGVSTTVNFHNTPVIWSVKEKDEWGRVISCGSHPEGITTGERRDLMAAMLRYAAEGNGTVDVKCELQNGTEYLMDQNTGTYAGIGDKQYHHYKVVIPNGAKDIEIMLEGYSDLTLCLSMRKAGIAWMSDADILLAQSGNKKTLQFSTLEAGTWYISVYCPAEVKTTSGSGKFTQTGDTEALNGVPYSLEVTWD